jgi:hypothetical protein
MLVEHLLFASQSGFLPQEQPCVASIHVRYCCCHALAEAGWGCAAMSRAMELLKHSGCVLCDDGHNLPVSPVLQPRACFSSRRPSLPHSFSPCRVTALKATLLPLPLSMRLTWMGCCAAVEHCLLSAEAGWGCAAMSRAMELLKHSGCDLCDDGHNLPVSPVLQPLACFS